MKIELTNNEVQEAIVNYLKSIKKIEVPEKYAISFLDKAGSEKYYITLDYAHIEY